jgi:Pyruvate/2-oxoacid:ferredoxin oxidoreductase delta subunit
MRQINLDRLLLSLELKYLKRALASCNGSKKQAAYLLGLNRTTFVEKLKRNGLFVRKEDMKQDGLCLRGHRQIPENGKWVETKGKTGMQKRFRCKLCNIYLKDRAKQMAKKKEQKLLLEIQSLKAQLQEQKI